MAHPKAGKPEEAVPVKFFAALLLSREYGDPSGVVEELERSYGPCDYLSAPHPFDATDYYEEEMGGGLTRRIASFEPLYDPTEIVRYKLESRAIEERFAIEGLRRVNVDPGYIDYFKVVLASFKVGPQKVYVGDGVYVDPVLMYSQGTFEPFPWSFPDFKKGVYNEDFLKIRKLYKEALRRVSGGS